MQKLRFLIACYGTPGIRGLEQLFAMGVESDRIRLLTHEADTRNECLHAFARANHIDIQAAPPDSPITICWAAEFRPDVLLSLHYRQKIPQSLLSIPSIASVNLHPSLLPRYRGCFSVPWAIISGDKVTGFTYHYMVESFDQGRIVFQQELKIAPWDTSFSLFHRQICDGLSALPKVLNLVAVERFRGDEQVGEGSYYPRKIPFNGYIQPDWDRASVERYLRAMHFPPLKGPLLATVDGDVEIKTIEDWLMLRPMARIGK